MKKYVSRTALIVSLAAAITTAVPASAGVLISFEEVGSDVVATVSGSITLPTPDISQSIFINNRIAPSAPFFEFGTTGSSVDAERYNFQTNFSAYGTKGFGGNPGWDNPGAGSGITNNERFSFNSTGINIVDTYVSGDPIDGTITWATQSFTTLGLTPGTYSSTLSNAETVTINVVPEPATCVLGLVSLGCGATFVIRRARGTKRAPRRGVRQS